MEFFHSFCLFAGLKLILKRIWGSGRGFPEHPNEETLSESQSSNLVVKCIQCKLSICQGVIFAIFYVYCIIAHLEHFSPMFEKYDLHTDAKVQYLSKKWTFMIQKVEFWQEKVAKIG